jgi:hypothetical protein
MMRTEVRRPGCPAERWYWTADQVSLLNVIARVCLTDHVPESVLGRAVRPRRLADGCLRTPLRDST